MVYTQEKRKDYNKKYYEKNRQKVIDYMCEKIECTFCKRKVCRNFYDQHKQTAICKNRVLKQQRDEQRLLTNINM